METVPIRKTFQMMLLRYMTEKGKTRKDLERDLGFKYSTIRDWEKGLTVPRVDKVELLANYFNCSKGDFLDERSEPVDTIGPELSPEIKKLNDKIKKLSPDKIRLLLQVAESIE